jgi:hypothetical protein
MLDIGGSYAFTVVLAASRNGNDQDRRHYTIAVSANDHADNLGVASATVTVKPRQNRYWWRIHFRGVPAY